jgi:8-oxo-dGTP pyrophosphatase MutT (NUDIX family)
MSVPFAAAGSQVDWTGKVIRAGTESFRYDDGAEVTRDKVWHPGAVGIVAVDDRSVWLTRQPREVVGAPASLEVPAGKLDVPGEPVLDTARRELAEEVGLRAARWTEVFAFYSSPGFSDERVWLYLAQELSDAGPAEAGEDERIEIVPWPLGQLDGALAECQDAKSLVALLWLKSWRV